MNTPMNTPNGRTTAWDRRGFALPAAILALVVVAILVTGGFFVAQQESRMSQATHQGTRAFYLAERGIAEVVDTWDNERFVQLPRFGSDVVSGTGDGGEWEVTVHRIGNQLYFLDSRGDITEAGQYGRASRRVGMIMRTLTVEIDVPAAVTTQGNVNMGGQSWVRGNDTDPAQWSNDDDENELCDAWSEDQPGVATTPDSEVNTGGAATLEGEPEWQEDESIDDDTFSDFGGLTWSELIALANHTIPGGGTLSGLAPVVDDNGVCVTDDPSNWGDGMNLNRPCSNFFPTIHIHGEGANTDINNFQGQGLLLVDGDLKIAGNFNFFGIIIAHGTVTLEGGGGGHPTIHGGILAANTELNPDGGEFSGQAEVHYSSCAIQRALAGLNNELTQLRPIAQRTWADVTAVSF